MSNIPTKNHKTKQTKRGTAHKITANFSFLPPRKPPKRDSDKRR